MKILLPALLISSHLNVRYNELLDWNKKINHLIISDPVPTLFETQIKIALFQIKQLEKPIWKALNIKSESLSLKASSHSINIKFDTDLFDIYLDTCCTEGLTEFMEDFVPGIFVEKDPSSTETIVGEAKLTGIGIVRYQLQDDNGEL